MRMFQKGCLLTIVCALAFMAQGSVGTVAYADEDDVGHATFELETGNPDDYLKDLSSHGKYLLHSDSEDGKYDVSFDYKDGQYTCYLDREHILIIEPMQFGFSDPADWLVTPVVNGEVRGQQFYHYDEDAGLFKNDDTILYPPVGTLILKGAHTVGDTFQTTVDDTTLDFTVEDYPEDGEAASE